MSIHATAIVDSGAELGDVEIGPYAVISAGVTLHDGVQVGPHSIIQGPTIVGANSVIHGHVSLGDAPQDRKHDGSATRLVIGENNVFREFFSAHRGSSSGTGLTQIGNDNYFMANSHVAHDCTVGSSCLVANSAAIAGHCSVGDGSVLGGLCALHQHGRIGRLAMVGGGAMCAQDVPPFSIAQGDRARLFGLNVIGLRRAGMSNDTIGAIKGGWRMLFTSGLSLRVAMGRTKEAFGDVAEVQELLEFLENSQRGVCRAAAPGGNS